MNTAEAIVLARLPQGVTRGSGNATDAGLSHQAELREIGCRVVIQLGSKKFALLIISTNRSDTGEAVMKKVRDVYVNSPMPTWQRVVARELLCQAVVIKSAVLSSYIFSDIEAGQILITEASYSAELTQAFFEPSILHGTLDFVPAHSQYMVARPPTVNIDRSSKKAILIGLQTDWKRVTVLFTTMSLVIAAIATLVGFLSHSADVGLAVASGGIGFVVYFETLVFWIVHL